MDKIEKILNLIDKLEIEDIEDYLDFIEYQEEYDECMSKFFPRYKSIFIGNLKEKNRLIFEHFVAIGNIINMSMFNEK